jgi:hypothetical protein
VERLADLGVAQGMDITIPRLQTLRRERERPVQVQRQRQQMAMVEVVEPGNWVALPVVAEVGIAHQVMLVVGQVHLAGVALPVLPSLRP